MQHRLQKVILLLLAVSPWCYGQASAMNGEISGTVTDPAGAAIANAAVSATNRGTGFRQTATYRGFRLVPIQPLATRHLRPRGSSTWICIGKALRH